ncbi:MULTISPECIES: UDP-glucose 4-epimerase GalE [Nitrosomonas]|uniref:UDP-glucose 4-epimerase n=1 Tax=Nitrosomonas communis TaxID=44574 RepID=A0A0F7KB56_9PROT|nr:MULTISPECIES: UDP-glucose 4-epimerase GalE [Nitrosomonas]AKH36796.1 UDP-galactose-4-epimerase [Nitrosomonas communis]TYP90185.1 UDP-glucose 4-epimerase [Nitrosomonas communis]UVS61872.1 UDP-glucose 4-epimerase GalE [Nitrosomonas sp. PLL12]
MIILVTGGAGYIGSHTIIELLNNKHDVIIIDNLLNSSKVAINRIEKIVGKKLTFYEKDVRNKQALEEIFSKHQIDGVIHFAGLKAVGESVRVPLKYYNNNLISTISLLEVMESHEVRQLVFSSSATVYGDPVIVPIKESATLPAKVTNPYGQTKLIIETMLMDLAITNNNWQITALRYFNPIGAHESGTIGEDPSDIPNNLMPYVSQVAVGKLKELSVFGNDYPTPDGTGVRDYIHVTDLAKAHVAALNIPATPNEYRAINVGTGKGTSVLELVNAFEHASGVKIPYKITDRRPGDIAACYADPSLAHSLLGWQAQKSLKDACADSWRWQSDNPNGYKG